MGLAHRTRSVALVSAAALAAVLLPNTAALAKPAGPKPAKPAKPHAATGGGAAAFSFGQIQNATVGQAGCGTNDAGEPALRVGADNNVILSSERGLGGGSEVWRGVQVGGSGASACGLTYAGQPNASGGFGASGGDVDVAIASAPNSTGHYNAYVASLNLASVSVSTSPDGGTTWSSTPVQGGIPGDDREWIAAFGANTSLLTYHDVASDQIDVLRSDNGGAAYTQIGQAINPSSTAFANGAVTGGNQHGNIAIDRVNTSGVAANVAGTPSFWAYQSFVTYDSSPNSTEFNEAYVGVSNDGGYTWNDYEIPCSIAANDVGLDHAFPNVAVDPAGRLWMTWSAGQDDTNGNNTSGKIFTALSTDHGKTWACSSQVSPSGTSIQPWLAATASGVDLVSYNAPTPGGTWSMLFQQNVYGSTGPNVNGWGAPTTVTSVHTGTVCEGGISCSTGRQLFDDFGVATDNSGWAHIAYSHDAPSLGGSGTYTGYAVQTGGTALGPQN